MIFFDTSSLFKKYFYEDGSEKVNKLFKEETEITVSPITLIELTNTLHRYFEEKLIEERELKEVFGQMVSDFMYFDKVKMSESFENVCFDLMKGCRLKSLDLIQLAAAKHAQAKLFITSDKQLYNTAKKILKCRFV